MAVDFVTWVRPAAQGTSCIIVGCGAPTPHEYTGARQWEPRDRDIWLALCAEHKTSPRGLQLLHMTFCGCGQAYDGVDLPEVRKKR